LVLAHQPFLSRPALRKAARDLVDSVHQTDPTSERTFKSQAKATLQNSLVSLWWKHARLHVVPVELAPGTGPTYKVEELAESLTLTMEKTDLFPSVVRVLTRKLWLVG